MWLMRDGELPGPWTEASTRSSFCFFPVAVDFSSPRRRLAAVGWFVYGHDCWSCHEGGDECHHH